MNDEIMVTEVATELTEQATVMEQPGNTGLDTAAKVGGAALLGLGVWKAGELIVKGFKKAKAWLQNRKAQKDQQAQPQNNQNPTDKDPFDQQKYGD